MTDIFSALKTLPYGLTVSIRMVVPDDAEGLRVSKPALKCSPNRAACATNVARDVATAFFVAGMAFPFSQRRAWATGAIATDIMEFLS